MSFEMRNNTAMSKRAEQLRRWEESDTAREPDYPKNEAGRRIKFSSGCVFLAACLSGERDEVLRLLEQGADIDTANTDGLTALHQACIDDNLEMVEFLVHNGADVNRQDNEGWTPLHATASCGFLSIARYLIESGANLAAVSSDGELVVDLADNDRMETLLQKSIDEQGIDCDEARQSEERLMLNDAKNWLRSDASEADKPHPRTGATALHVAAAKGYSKVLSLLLATRSDVDKQDNDGWTPLHAASHWGQKDAAQMLVAALADMDIKNYAGQTIFDVADSSILRYLEDLKKNNKRSKRRPPSQIRISDGMDNHIESTQPKVIRVEVKPSGDSKDVDEDKPKAHNTEQPAKLISKEIITVPEEDTPWRRTGSLRPRQQPDSPPKSTLPASPEKEPITPAAIAKAPSQPPPSSTVTESEVILRRTQSFENDEKFYQKYHELRARIKANSCPVLPATPIAGGMTGSCSVINSVGTGTTPTSTTPTLLGSQILKVQRSVSLKDHRQLRKTVLSPVVGSPVMPPPPSSAATTPTATVHQSGGVRRSAAEELVRSQFNAFRNMPSPGIQLERTFGRQTRHGGSTQSLNRSTPDAVVPLSGRNANSITELPLGPEQQSVVAVTAAAPPTTADGVTQPRSSKFAPGNMIKNFFKSFVPPSRDEESETQRKAHAKRVRETRRSTQGVTLDEIKSAEELIKKNNMNNNNNFKLEDVVVTLAAPVTVNTTITATGAVTISPQRRSNQGAFESAARPVSSPAIGTNHVSAEPVNDRITGGTTNNTTSTNSSSGSSSSSNTSATAATGGDVVTLPLRRSKATDEDKENDKENDSRSAQATQAVIQRRRRPKRRSTGVVHADDIDPERHEGGADGAEERESGSERASRSRLGSTSSMVSDGNDLKSDSTENGDHIDYKALYEAAKLDNDKLKQQLKKKDEDLSNAKATVDRFANATTKNSLSELEKRERRAMERKLSEMEEELKHLEALKTENQRLKDENGALIRVISKLSK